MRQRRCRLANRRTDVDNNNRSSLRAESDDQRQDGQRRPCRDRRPTAAPASWPNKTPREKSHQRAGRPSISDAESAETFSTAYYGIAQPQFSPSADEQLSLLIIQTYTRLYR